MKKKADKKRGIIQKNIIIVLIIALLAAIFMLCMGYYKKATYIVKNPIATIEVENYGTMKIELYPDQAPNTVNNFITLANNQFYDGLTFHRIIKDFMIQGGDINKDGTGSPTLSYIDNSIEKNSDSDKEYNIDGEFMNNDFESNTLKLGKGVIAMARNDFSSYAYYYPTLLKKGYNTAGSQFFIMTTDNYTSLTGSYAGFGKVIEGLDVLEKIADTKVTKVSEDSTEESKPEEAPVIKSIRVETFDTNYKMPKTHEPFDINSYFTSQMSASY